MRNQLNLLGIALALLCLSSRAAAHFPWMTIDDDGKAVYFFGETPDDRTYKLPPSIKKADVAYLSKDGTAKKVGLDVVESDSFVGLISSAAVPADASLTSTVTYGVYHGARLNYFTQHVAGKLPSDRKASASISKQLDLHAQLVDTDSGVDVFVVWKGEPLVDAEVRLFCAEGHEEGTGTTDKTGKVSFTDKQVEEGLNGIVVGFTEEGESGQIDDQAYTSVSRYLTATFVDPQDFQEPSSGASLAVTSDALPPIPEMVTSFGAAITGDALYLYGGHTGRAHEYYVEAQANTLWRLDLKHPKAWESVGDGPRLQGLAMVAHGGKLYRIGGFTAKNSDGEKKDLWSQAAVATFDPPSNTWSDLPPLPEPRSSFDAVVMGDRIYVIGGWSMQGGDTKWLDTAHVLDLAQQPLRWQALPEPPFQRRALSVAAGDGKVFAIGGMQRVGGPTTRVDVFDTKSQSWSRGPDLNGEEMDGFGSSAFFVGNRLYVTTYSGALQRLAEDGKSWETLGRLERDRFFHRLLPLSNERLVAVGGASMSSGKFEELDVIEIQ